MANVSSWHGDKVLHKARQATRVRLRRCALIVEREAKRLLSKGAGATGKSSKAGAPPHVRSGALRSSVGYAIMPGGLAAIVGPTVKYGKMHEFGTRGAGGTLPDIKPKKARALAIPIDKSAQGRSPRSFKDLSFIKPKGKAPMLMQFSGKTMIHAKLMYVLVKSVALAPRPFMRPALRNSRRKFAEQFRGMLK